jgi:hypothetical protein
VSRGYIIIAQNSNVDHLRLSYALALSIKATQEENLVCLCVDNKTGDRLEQKHLDIFDYIIDIPWKDDAISSKWKIENKWKYIHMSPFDHTIILDSDQLFTGPVDHWWDILAAYDVCLCSNARTFRDEPITNDYYRKKFTSCELPDIYSNFTYFNKSNEAFQYFNLVQDIMENWDYYYNVYLNDDGQDWISADIAFSLAAKLLPSNSSITINSVVPQFIHMKSYVQNIPNRSISANWNRTLPSYITDDLRIFINNQELRLPFHYVEKDWLTDSIIEKYENVVLCSSV